MILELKRAPGIFLVGFMGSGKTTVGTLLAARLGWRFADLDDDIEAQAGMPIAAIFDTRGEAEFRRLETEALERQARVIRNGQPTVVALGGGAFPIEANRVLVARSGVSVWLDCPLALAAARVAGDANRPLAREAEKFARLYQERQAAYAHADFRVAVSDNDGQRTAEAILALPFFAREG
jgi:shikimate kinase